MFAGGRRRSSSVRAMQLFHELKQQFPTVPDHVVSACIASTTTALESMGRQPPETTTTTDQPITDMDGDTTDTAAAQQQQQQQQTNHVGAAFYDKKSDSVSVTADEAAKVGNSSFFVKRPTHLDIGGGAPKKDCTLKLSEKCKDVHKLLNSDKVNEKPPRSPLSAKRLAAKASPSSSPLAEGRKVTPPTTPKRETVETPTQTTLVDTPSSVNLSLNVNCSVVHSPTHPRRSSVLQLTPQQPWMQEPVSPRSYTSVNLTLRPPTSEPQAPIDITSQNSSLTYSTSTFDPHKGLQSRLQITVGPGGSGSVSSVRTRPRSSYFPEHTGDEQEVVPTRAGSLPDLAAKNEPLAVIRQQARIERLRIELKTEKAKVIILKQEITELENNQNNKADEELEKQLQKEIQHLRCQCEQLTRECDRNDNNRLPNNTDVNEDFYRNIYPGQRGPITLDFPMTRQARPRLQYQGPTSLPQPDFEGPKWNCHMCTFQNHPLLDKCEQCEMPRILHGTKTTTPTSATPAAATPNPADAFNMVRPLGQTGPYVPAAFNALHRFPSNHPAAYNPAFAQRFLRNTANPGTINFGQGRSPNSGPVSHV